MAILTVRDDFLAEQLMKSCQRCAWGAGCTEIEVEKAIVGQTLSEVCWVSVVDVLGSSKNESNSNPNDRPRQLLDPENVFDQDNEKHKGGQERRGEVEI